MFVIIIIIALILALVFHNKSSLRLLCIAVIMLIGFWSSMYLYTGHRIAWNRKAQTESKPFNEEWSEGVSDMCRVCIEHTSPLLVAMLALGVCAVCPRKKDK